MRLSACALLLQLGAAVAAGVEPGDLLKIVDIVASDANPLAISPDGRSLVVQTTRAVPERDAIEIRWTILPTQGKDDIINVADGGELVPVYDYFGTISEYAPPEGARWSPDSQWIAFRAKHEGRIQLWRARRDGKLAEQLTHGAADVELFRWSEDGRRIYFSVAAQRAALESSLRLESKRGFLYDGRFVPLHRTAPLIDNDALGTQPRTYDVVTGTEKPSTESELDEYERLQHPATLGARPHAQRVRRAKNSGFTVWLEDLRKDSGSGVRPLLALVGARRSDGSDAVVCVHERCRSAHFMGLWVDPKGEAAYFLRWAGAHDYGPIALYRWTPSSSTVEEILRTEDFLDGCSQRGERLICARETATTPKHLVSIALADGSWKLLHDFNIRFQTLEFGEVVPLYWHDPQGIEGFGRLVKPLGYRRGKRYPLIVVQYRSRGFLRGGVGDEYPIHAFASRGFAVLSFHRPDLRDLEESSQSALEVEAKGWVGFLDRRRVLSVLQAGIDRLDEMGIIDPKRVGITGLSDGSETVEFALVHAPARFAAAAASGTFWNPMTYYLAGPAAQSRFLQAWGFGDPTGAAIEHWRGMSIALNARRVWTPLLIQVSDTELLPVTQTFTALREFGKPVELYVFQNEGHVKWQPLHRWNIYRRNLQWFQFWLQSIETPEPVDSGQYSRWRELRSKSRSSSVSVHHARHAEARKRCLGVPHHGLSPMRFTTMRSSTARSCIP